MKDICVSTFVLSGKEEPTNYTNFRDIEEMFLLTGDEILYTNFTKPEIVIVRTKSTEDGIERVLIFKEKIYPTITPNITVTQEVESNEM